MKHEITGCALLRLSDDALRRMGIINNQDREAIWREILKQRLKTDIIEIRDMEFMDTYYEWNVRIEAFTCVFLLFYYSFFFVTEEFYLSIFFICRD